MITIERIFSSSSSLQRWLEDKNWECGSPEKFNEWLCQYFDEGNTINVCGELYDYFVCLELV